MNVMRRGVVAVVIRDRKLLVIRRSQHVVAPGAYCFPGGGIEPDDTEEQALVREMHEELRVEVTPLRRLWESVTPWGTHLGWWLAVFDDSAAIDPDEREIESFAWCTLQEIAALPGLLESNHHFLAALERGEIVIDI